MSSRKISASAVRGPMLNPSVEPRARRESAQTRIDDEAMVRRDSARRSSFGKDSDRGSSVGALADGPELEASTAALEARNQRRSVGLQRLSINLQMKETLIRALQNVVRQVGMSTEATGIEKLQDIMTEAKEKGLGASKLFQFFLLNSDDASKRDSADNPSKRTSTTSVEPKTSTSADAENPEDTADATDTRASGESSTGGVFKETQASKYRMEAAKTLRTTKKKSTELMPSLQKGNRPSTASSKRGSGSRLGSDQRPISPDTARTGKDDETATTVVDGSSGLRRSLSRRSSSAEELLVRDRLITLGSFHHGLLTLGFKPTEQEATDMFHHLDANQDGNIDLREFTRFCLEIPSMAWKAERARRGVLTTSPGADANRELEKAARDMANEAVSASDFGDASLSAGAASDARKKLEPPVDLGKVVFKCEKFFWRTRDLIEIVLQLNAKEGFIAISTFHTDSLKVYPVIFVDPAKIPINAALVAKRTSELEFKELEIKQAADMGVSGRHVEHASDIAQKGVASQEGEEQTLAEKAHIMYIADYLVHRIIMPDQNGNFLQPDLTQPEAQVNPEIPSQRDPEGKSLGGAGDVTAKPRPGLTRTTFDEWDTLLYSNPPGNVKGAPEFPKQKRRESYFLEFKNTTGEFDANCTKARRLSAEAEAYTEEISLLMRRLAPLNYSASSPAILQGQQSARAGDPRANLELNGRPGSGRIVLEDGLSQGPSDSARNSLLESQSVPVLPSQEKAGAVEPCGQEFETEDGSQEDSVGNTGTTAA